MAKTDAIFHEREWHTKAALQEAIKDTVEMCAEDPEWEGYIHDLLYQQMAEAAWIVMAAAMDAQAFATEADDED